MQNKGIVKFIAIVLILVCCFYLSFSYRNRSDSRLLLLPFLLIRNSLPREQGSSHE